MRCVLVGNYGAGNLGDDALRDYFLQQYPDVQWTVVSAAPDRPNDVPRLPLGLRSLFTPWWRTIAAMRTCDAVVFGGGSLFTDSESVFACLLWRWHAMVAQCCGKPIILAFQGIGPLRTSLGRHCTRKTVVQAAAISVRDEESLQRVMPWRTDAVLTFDPVFEGIVMKTTRGSDLAVIPRMNSTPAFRTAVESAVRRVQPPSVKIISMQPGLVQEQDVCKLIADIAVSPSSLHAVRSVDALVGALSSCSLVITERYHGALAAFALGIPMEVIVQQPGDKLDALKAFMQRPEARVIATQRLRAGAQQLQKILNMVK